MQPVVIGDVIWEPSPEVIARSRLKRFMDRHGIETFDELLRRADDDIEWFWDAAVKDLDVAFYRDYDKVVDLSQGKAWARWWIGARMNIVATCLDRQESDRPSARRPRDPLDAWPGRGLGSPARGSARPREYARARSRRPADDHLHLGHDGQAERDTARSRRVSHQVRAGHGALLRH